MCVWYVTRIIILINLVYFVYLLENCIVQILVISPCYTVYYEIIKCHPLFTI